MTPRTGPREDQALARTTTPPRPHQVQGGAALLCGPGAVRDQARVAMAWFSVFDGRITASALAGSGW